MPIRVIPSFNAPQIATQPVDLAGAFLGPIAAGQAMAQARQRAEQAAVAAQLAEQLAPLKLQQEQLQLQEIQQRINDQAALAPINRLLQQIALREAGVFAPTPARAGVPSALTALPVSAGEQAIIESAPDIFGPRAPQVEQIVSPLERPIVTPEGFVYDPITARAKTIGESTQKIKETELLEEAKARGKARGESDFAAPIKLDKTVTETKVLWTHPNTGEVVKSLDIDPSKKYFSTEGGVRVIGADGKLEFLADPVVAGKGAVSEYTKERKQRTLDSVAKLKGKVSPSTVGFGAWAKGVPRSKALNFAAELDTLKASIAFNELTEMREASKTGGALGSIAVRELELLQNALGGLDQRQREEDILENLNKIEDVVKRWAEAKGVTLRTTPPPSATPTGAPKTAVEYFRKFQ